MNYAGTVKNASQLFSIYGSMKPAFGAEVEAHGNEITFEGDGYQYRSVFTPHESGVYKRSDEIRNTSEKELSVTSVLSRFVFNGGEYEVYTQYGQWCLESAGKWQPLTTEICAENDDVRASAGASPFMALFCCQSGRGIAFHILSKSIWKIKARKHFLQKNGEKDVYVELGINDRDLEIILKPGESLKLPEILFYEFTNKTDMDAYKLHRYLNDVYPAKKTLPVVYNSWMSRFDKISFEALSGQLEVAKKIGVEYFVIDAGWFGKPDLWFESVGDWVELPDFSMQGRMKEFSDLVRASGIKFGLWFEIERAAEKSKSAATHTEHYIFESGNYFVNFARPETCDYIFNIISVQIKKYGIEYIKFDFNAPITFDSDKLSFMKYMNGFSGFMKRLEKEFPGLYRECCASGGMRMALSGIESFDSFWMSDDHSLFEELEIFKNTILRMPPRALETWITIRSLPSFSPVPKRDYQDKILMSADGGWERVEEIEEEYLRNCSVGGPVGISCDICELIDGHVDILKDIVIEHKKQRSFFASAECRILCDTATMLVLQFNDRDFNDIKVYSFVKKPEQTALTVYPVCSDGAKYKTADGEIFDGSELQSDGACLTVGKRLTSNKLILKKI